MDFDEASSLLGLSVGDLVVCQTPYQLRTCCLGDTYTDLAYPAGEEMTWQEVHEAVNTLNVIHGAYLELFRLLFPNLSSATTVRNYERIHYGYTDRLWARYYEASFDLVS